MPTVALIGDSVAFGIGFANDQSPSAHVAELVARFGFQVQNLGVAGYGPVNLAGWWSETLRNVGVEVFDFKGLMIERGLAIEDVYCDPIHFNPDGSRPPAEFLVEHTAEGRSLIESGHDFEAEIPTGGS